MNVHDAESTDRMIAKFADLMDLRESKRHIDRFFQTPRAQPRKRSSGDATELSPSMASASGSARSECIALPPDQLDRTVVAGRGEAEAVCAASNSAHEPRCSADGSAAAQCAVPAPCRPLNCAVDLTQSPASKKPRCGSHDGLAMLEVGTQGAGGRSGGPEGAASLLFCSQLAGGDARPAVAADLSLPPACAEQACVAEGKEEHSDWLIEEEDICVLWDVSPMQTSMMV